MFNLGLRDEIRRLEAETEYLISTKERYLEYWSETAKKLQRVEDQLKVEKADGYAAIESIGRQSSRLWHLENQIIQRDKEIALLKYQAANPTFGSTHTPAVQEKKGKRK